MIWEAKGLAEVGLLGLLFRLSLAEKVRKVGSQSLTLSSLCVSSRDLNSYVGTSLRRHSTNTQVGFSVHVPT